MAPVHDQTTDSFFYCTLI